MIEHQYENRCDNTMLLQSPQKRCTDAPPQRAICDTVSQVCFANGNIAVSVTERHRFCFAKPL